MTPRTASERAAKQVDDWNKKLADNKAHWGNVKIAEFGKDSYEIVPAGSADLVMTSRNVHNWMGAGIADQAFAAFYKALKPGGILSVEEHRAPADKPQDPKARTATCARTTPSSWRKRPASRSSRSPRCWRIRRTPRTGEGRVDAAADAADGRDGSREIPGDRRGRQLLVKFQKPK
jgi:SAM-dependent methyltransferase